MPDWSAAALQRRSQNRWAKTSTGATRTWQGRDSGRRREETERVGESVHTAKEQESPRRRGSGRARHSSDDRGKTSTQPVNERYQVTVAPRWHDSVRTFQTYVSPRPDGSAAALQRRSQNRWAKTSTGAWQWSPTRGDRDRGWQFAYGKGAEVTEVSQQQQEASQWQRQRQYIYAACKWGITGNDGSRWHDSVRPL